MPIYDYKCDKCGEEFEKVFFDFKEDSETAECPKCKNPKAKKIPSVFGKHISWTTWNNLSN